MIDKAQPINAGGTLPSEHVIGRDEIVAEYWTVLRQRSILLAAPKRYGKTSVLTKLAQARPEEAYLVRRSVQSVSTALEFAELLYLDVKSGLSRKTRTRREGIQLFETLAGTEIAGVLKLPLSESGQWKKIVSELMQDLLSEHDLVVFLWDEFTAFLSNLDSAQPGSRTAAAEMIEFFRDLRQSHPKLRMVIAGSTGINALVRGISFGLHSDAFNDLKYCQLPPLSKDAAELLVKRLCASAGLAEPAEDCIQALCKLTSGIPFYIQQVIEANSLGSGLLTKDGIEKSLNDAVNSPNDPWQLLSSLSRIRSFYSASERSAIVSIMNSVCKSVDGMQRSELCNIVRNELEAAVLMEIDAYGMNFGANAVINKLASDSYLTFSFDDYRFRLSSEPLRRAWMLYSGHP